MLFALLMMVGCSSPFDETAGAEEQSGSLLMSFDVTRSGDDTSSNDLLESATLRIYNSEGGLVRYYKDLSGGVIDYLSVGFYSAKISIGGTYATFDTAEMSYDGECESFEISSQQTTDVTVDVTLRNTIVSIIHEESLNDHYTGYYTKIAVANSVAEVTSSTPQLDYTSSGDGYFIVEDEVENLVWQFCDESGVVAQGLIEGVERAHQYQLTFKHTDYLDVSGMSISFGEEETFDDILGFKPQPVIKGSGFDIADVQNYVGGDYKLSVTSLLDVTSISATVGKQTYSWGKDSELSYDSSAETLTLSSTLFEAISQGGVNSIFIEALDSNGSSGNATMSVGITGFVGTSNEDFWNNTATMSWYSTTQVSKVDMQFRKSGDEEWSGVYSASPEEDGYTWSAVCNAEWSSSTNGAGLYIWQLTRGYAPSTEYEFQIVVDDSEPKVVAYTSPDVEQEIDTVSDSGLSCYTASNTNAVFWASGNNSYSSTLCSYDSSTQSADLNSQSITVLFVTKFAAGNMYTGTFAMDGYDGVASFGQVYDWVARPKSLKFNYKVTVGDDDRGRVFFAIVDWTSRRSVTTPGLGGDVTGSWDPTNTSSLTEGDIIGYGSIYFDDDVSAMTEYELPIYYYDTTAKPTTGNYSIVISTTASWDGENLNGSTGSELWLKDFKFGY